MLSENVKITRILENVLTSLEPFLEGMDEPEQMSGGCCKQIMPLKLDLALINGEQRHLPRNTCQPHSSCPSYAHTSNCVADLKVVIFVFYGEMFTCFVCRVSNHFVLE